MLAFEVFLCFWIFIPDYLSLHCFYQALLAHYEEFSFLLNPLQVRLCLHLTNLIPLAFKKCLSCLLYCIYHSLARIRKAPDCTFLQIQTASSSDNHVSIFISSLLFSARLLIFFSCNFLFSSSKNDTPEAVLIVCYRLKSFILDFSIIDIWSKFWGL